MGAKKESRDLEIVGIFVFLALLTLALVSGLRWVVLTPDSTVAPATQSAEIKP
jgi:hypothetical protein